MRSLSFLVAAVAVVHGCDCSNEVAPPGGGGSECTQNTDCAFNGFCRDGTCQSSLPVEGEGEGGEGEEGEGEGNEGEGEPAAEFVIAPTSLTLPAADIGSSSTSSAQIVNTGDVAISVTSITSSNGAFTVTAPAIGTSIAPSNSAALAVTFTPAAAGTTTATITVTANGTAKTLAVSGNAAQAIEDGALVFSAGPDDDGIGLDACECKAPFSPANVDISYKSGANTCAKPANIACGIGDDCAPCSLGVQGQARWRAGRLEQRQGDTPFIVDEEIIHQGAGADGDFILSTTVVTDCVATVASIGAGTNEACCQFVDCGGANACYPYEEPISCGLDCSAFAQSATANDCLATGPVLVRARVTLDDVERDFCVTMTESQTVEVARVRRTAGAFSITSVGSSVVEVAADDACP